MNALLETHDLGVGHGGRPLIGHVGLRSEAGTLTALLGVNGIGKSTLLRTLAGLLRPISGQVRIQGKDLAALGARERARLVSIVLTGRPLSGVLDVATVVALGRQPWTGNRGRLTAEDDRSVQQALTVAGAVHLRERALDTLSDGECQKVMLARALAQSTPVVLLDEPTAFLDLPSRVGIVRALREAAHTEGKAILFSTHDLQLALDLCDRLLLMRVGAPIWSGTPAEAIAQGELERAFAGTGIRFNAEHGTHRFLP
jgi:iron complex transport system ATP-binding protein